MRIVMPDKVNNIIQVIQAAGHEAYAVGGCVRDSVLGRIPDDWDITTSASPVQVKELFRRTVDTGLQHGTVTVLQQNEGFEVTTYRIDGVYEDGRHPKEVTFTGSLAEDLKRRDFTINAMAYSDREGLIDLFNGMEDIQKRVIRCVGDPMERFREDALRMMRAVRFSAQLGYAIDKDTERAIGSLAPTLQRISAERVRTELVKLVTSRHPDYLRKAYETGITAVILPEWDACMETAQHNPHHCYTVGEHILHGMLAVKADKVLRLAMLCHDIGKPLNQTVDQEGIHHFYRHSLTGEEITKNIMRRLKFDNDTLIKVSKLVRFHDDTVEAAPKCVRRAMLRMGEDIFPLYLLIREADVRAQSDYQRDEKLACLKELHVVYNKVLADRDCVSLKDLAVTGRDLIEAGITPGKQMGEILQALLLMVIENPEYNSKEYLLQAALTR